MQQNPPSASQLKNEQFKNQIRSRMKADYMRKIRNQFLRLEQLKPQQNYIQKLTTEQLKLLISQLPNKQRIGLMNRIILQKRQQINYEMFENLTNYILKNFINQQTAQLIKKIQLIDLISLFANIISITKYQNYIKTLNLTEITNMLINLIKITQNQQSCYILWVLHQLIEIDARLAQIIAPLQNQFSQKFGLSNIYLSYLLCSLIQYRPDLIEATIIHEYTFIPINKQTEKSYCLNIFMIFSAFIRHYKNTDLTQSILKWVCTQILSPNFDFLIKNNLFYLLQYMIKQCLDLPNLICLINQPSLLQQVIQRSLFDSQYQNKISCINSINKIIQISPKLQLQDIIQNYPSILQSIIESFKLCDYKLSIQSLLSVAKILLNWPNQIKINRMFRQGGLRMQLEVLQLSQNVQVSNLAASILEDYLAEE